MLLLALRSSLVFLAASRFTSLSALSEMLLPAVIVEPRTVMSESAPAPLALTLTSPPADTVEPAALLLVCAVVLRASLRPTERLSVMPPALLGSRATAS